MIPTDGSAAWLSVASPADRHDGKLVHLDGLNLSRAWMLDGIESAAGWRAILPSLVGLLVFGIAQLAIYITPFEGDGGLLLEFIVDSV